MEILICSTAEAEICPASSLDTSLLEETNPKGL